MTALNREEKGRTRRSASEDEDLYDLGKVGRLTKTGIEGRS
jgi:hypothetical protein